MSLRTAGTFAAALAVGLCALAPPSAGQHQMRPTRVLVLYQQQPETQPMLEFGEQLRRTLRADFKSPIEFYQEPLDFDRFAGRQDSSPLASYFEDKYRQFGIDVVVPVGSRALQFAVERLRGVLPNVPIVFALCASPQTDPARLPADVTGRLAAAARFERTLLLAHRLQADAERVVVIGGAGPSDSVSVLAVARAEAGQREHLPVVALQGLTLDTLLRRVHDIPPRSIVVFANYREDGRGQVFEPLDIVGSIAHATSAPMYTQLGSYVGEGVVGGAVTRFDDEGALTGLLVARVLRRAAGVPMPPVESITNTFVVDWRQLRRWSLAESRLPPTTELLFREPTPWQRYRAAILVALALIVFEAALVGSLLVERRRRRRAQGLADERQRRAEEARRQVAHLGRLATVGELAATIAHELRQSLAAIRTNAETGAKLMRPSRDGVASDEQLLCREIFTDIISDDQRASEIITRVRTLVRREDLPQQPVDLNDVCRLAVRLLQHEAQARHVELVLSLDPRLPAVGGDAVQLQQVVLNLALNAVDASVSSSTRRVTITTVGRDEEVEVLVHDTGPGIPVAVQRHLFESFFTTKPDGLGLGLSIVQSIVERHQGRVRADNAEGGGALFRVLLPRNNRIRSEVERDGETLKASAATASGLRKAPVSSGPMLWE